MAPRKIAKLTQSTCIFFLLILSLATTAQCQTNKNVVNPVQSAQTEPQQILVLGSYLPGLPISENIRSGILAALQEGVFGFAHIFIEHLDFTCAPASELRTDIVNLLHHKLAQKRVGVVITIGAPATDFMTREGKSLFPDAMVITLISPNYQVLSGTYNRTVNIPWRVDPSGTLRVALDLYPQTRRVFVVTGANDKILPFLDQARKAFAPWQGKLEIEYSNEMTYDEMLHRVATLSSDAIVIYSPFFSDSTGQPFVPAEVVTKVCQLSTVPVFATLEEYMGSGIVGGSLLKTMDIGRQAGKVALDYLNDRLKLVEPVTTLEPNSLYEFDWRVLDRWKTDISTLPKGSIFINQPLTLWGQYKVTVIVAATVILVMGLLVVALTIMNRRLRRMTIAANDSEEKFQTLFDRASDGIMIMTPDGKLVAVNESFASMHGYSVDEILVIDLQTLDLPKTRHLIGERMHRLLLGESAIFEVEHYHKDGSVFPLEVSASIILSDGETLIQSFHRDISDRKLAEERLRSSEECFKALAEASFGGIIIHDKGLILECNTGLSTLTGFNYAEHIGMNGLELIAPESLDTVLANIRSGFDQRYEVIGVRKDGTKYPLAIRGKNVTYKGSEARVIEFRDITDSKRVEEENQALEQQLQQSQKLESLGVLSGGIAHDFNNILAVIVGYCGLTKMNYGTAEKNIPEIEKAAERAAGLCRQMLVYAGKAQFTMTKVNMVTKVDEIVGMLKSTLPQNAIIKTDLSAQIPLIEGDASQLRQVVMNLIINASEAIDTEQGEVGVSLARIEVKAGKSYEDYYGKAIPPGEYVCLEVTDNGCGMDEATKWRIFEPFYTTKFTGRGLGMSAVLGIITSHAGALQLFSLPGHGTTFKVYLPIPMGETAGDEDQTASVPAVPWQGSGTILLAEDEEQVRFIAKELLEMFGFTVLDAVNGKEALEIYLKNAAEITLVVTDMGMPVMDGCELFSELKKLSPDLPIIISSGFGDAEVSARIGIDNIAGLISKPYDFSQLRKVLKTVVEGTASTNA